MPLAQGIASKGAGAGWDGAADAEESDDDDRTLARHTEPARAIRLESPKLEMPAPVDALYSMEKDEGGAAEADPILALLSRQAASGLWEEPGKDPIETTAAVLVALLRLGVTAAHAVHGALVKKAVEALLERFTQAAPKDPRIVQLALGAAWLLATGRRTKKQIEEAAQKHGAMVGDEQTVRAEVERLA
jgi:hypothetical protein